MAHKDPNKPVDTMEDAVCKRMRAELKHLTLQLGATTDLAKRTDITLRIAVLELALKNCKPPATAPGPSPYPNLGSWMDLNYLIARHILWQKQPADVNNVYAPPTDADKVPWGLWTPAQKMELEQVYLDCCAWFDAGAPQAQLNPTGLTDAPVNTQPNVPDDGVTVLQEVTPVYMWRLYLAHVGFTLAAELTNRLPWSITSYDPTSLRYLFDSTTMGWQIRSGDFWLGTYAQYVPALRENNRACTSYAPPQWVYPLLQQSGLLGNTRLQTIGLVLQWMQLNMSHFYGLDNFGNADAVWQYRGYPPISRVISGTIDANNPSIGSMHWTMGCHGSVGFLSALLRVVGIPVQPVWIAGHELAYFLTERLYLDHGDDPYNLNVRNSQTPILQLLIDDTEYKVRFTNNDTINILDPNDPAALSIGRSAANFPP